MNYSIAAQTLIDLAKRRAESVKLARDYIKRQRGKHWRKKRTNGKSDSALGLQVSTHASVSMINGSRFDGALAVKPLAAWARDHGKRAVFDLRLTPGAVILSRGASTLRVYHKPEVSIERGRKSRVIPAGLLGQPLRLVAPAEGGEFVLDMAPLLP